MTGVNRPAVSSPTVPKVVAVRSSDFGVKTMSGLRCGRRAWRRSRWKWLAAVVGTTTRMLCSAQSVRNRSMRADECSGPWPSKPCGSNRTTPDRWAHLSSPAEMNWSTITWAPLAKSPNWASHSTSVSGDSTA